MKRKKKHTKHQTVYKTKSALENTQNGKRETNTVQEKSFAVSHFEKCFK